MATVKKTELLIGTSGWSYEGSRGSCYPEDIPKRCWLQYYASVFSSAEINGVLFDRTLSLEALRRWRARRDPVGFHLRLEGVQVHHALETAHAEVQEFDRSDDHAPQGNGTEGRGRLVSTSATVRQGRASAALIPQDVAQRISLCVRVSRPGLV